MKDLQGEQVNILTFDIEEWFLTYSSQQLHINEWDKLEYRAGQVILDLLDFLARKNLKATFFCLGHFAMNHKDIVREMALKGHDIGYHSFFHDIPFKMSADDFQRDLEKGLSLLLKITGQKIEFYRAPEFSLNHKEASYYELLRNFGIIASSSVRMSLSKKNAYKVSPFEIHTTKGSLIEFPLPQRRIFGFNMPWSGGGYFRILPYQYIKQSMQERAYNMFYFHPRDFDDQIPWTPRLPVYRNIMNRAGNKTTIPKLQKLIEAFQFRSISEALGNLKSRQSENYSFLETVQ